MKKKLTSLLIALSMLASTTAFADAIPEAAAIGIIGGADGPTEVYISEPAPIEEMPAFDYSVFTHPAPEMPFTNEIATQFGIEGTANIYYNSEYLDPAIIIGGRTLLPFRAFLESVGATVDYDDATRTASAVKKDTTVSFNLDSDTISIVTAEGTSEMKMDVMPVIIEGHSYVPIRFLSEAFGMQVSWSDWEHTAVIADFDAYMDAFIAKCPNIAKLIEIGSTVPERSYSVASADFVFDLNAMNNVYSTDESGMLKTESYPTKVNLDFSLDAEGTTVGMEADSNLTASVKYSDTEGNTFDLSNCTLDIIFKDNTYYIKTNILSELATKGIIDANDIPPSLLNSDAWYELSLDNYFTLLTNMTGAEFDTGAVTKLMENANDPKAVIEYVLSNMGEINSTYMLDAITQMIEVYAGVDEYITITETGENIYDVALEFDVDSLLDLVMDFAINISNETGGYVPSDEEIAEAREELEEELEGLVFDLSVTGHIENGVTTSQKVYMNLSFEEGTDKMKLLMDVTSTVDPKANVTDIEAPENSIDILGRIYG